MGKYVSNIPKSAMLIYIIYKISIISYKLLKLIKASSVFHCIC
nr:MAG TPA: hypothetical protein [Bacteriophage sp.]